MPLALTKERAFKSAERQGRPLRNLAHIKSLYERSCLLRFMVRMVYCRHPEEALHPYLSFAPARQGYVCREIQEDKDVLEIAKHDVFYVCACSQISNRFGCLINVVPKPLPVPLMELRK